MKFKVTNCHVSKSGVWFANEPKSRFKVAVFFITLVLVLVGFVYTLVVCEVWSTGCAGDPLRSEGAKKMMLSAALSTSSSTKPPYAIITNHLYKTPPPFTTTLFQSHSPLPSSSIPIAAPIRASYSSDYESSSSSSSSSSPAKALRRLLESPGLHQGPACFDALSAKLVQSASFQFCFTSGIYKIILLFFLYISKCWSNLSYSSYLTLKYFAISFLISLSSNLVFY